MHWSGQVSPAQGTIWSGTSWSGFYACGSTQGDPDRAGELGRAKLPEAWVELMAAVEPDHYRGLAQALAERLKLQTDEQNTDGLAEMVQRIVETCQSARNLKVVLVYTWTRA